MLSYLVVQPAVRTGKDRLSHIHVGAQTSQCAAVERQIRWLQADPQSTIRMTNKRARELRKNERSRSCKSFVFV